MGEPYEKYFLLVNLKDAGRPRPEIKDEINRQFNLMKNKLKHVAYFTEKNYLVNVTLKFVMSRSSKIDYSVHKTIDQAISYIKKIA